MASGIGSEPRKDYWGWASHILKCARHHMLVEVRGQPARAAASFLPQGRTQPSNWGTGLGSKCLPWLRVSVRPSSTHAELSSQHFCLSRSPYSTPPLRKLSDSRISPLLVLICVIIMSNFPLITKKNSFPSGCFLDPQKMGSIVSTWFYLFCMESNTMWCFQKKKENIC